MRGWKDEGGRVAGKGEEGGDIMDGGQGVEVERGGKGEGRVGRGQERW